MNAAVALVQQLSPVLYPGYLNLDPRVEWWSDQGFICFLRRFGEDRRTNAHRRWMLYQLLRLTAPIDGDTAECGVFRGSSSWLICQSNLGTGKPNIYSILFPVCPHPARRTDSIGNPGCCRLAKMRSDTICVTASIRFSIQAGSLAISEFPKWRKYLISLSFRGQSSVRPVQVGGFDVNIVIHRSTAVRGRGGPARHDAWPPSLGAILAHTDGPCGS